MAIIKVRGTGVGGISEDIPASELPLNVFSYGENVVFGDSKIENIPEVQEVLKGVHGEVQWFAPRYNQVTKEPELVYVSRDSEGYDRLYLIKDGNLDKTDGTEKGVEASRLPPEGEDYPYFKVGTNRFSRWQGFSSNGVVVLTNGADVPQVLLPDSDHFIDLPNWDSSKRCKAIVPMKGVWVAMNIYDELAPIGRQLKDTMVMWSSPLADIGTYPETWDATLQTGAGFNFLAETAGSIQVGAPLRDSFLIYKTDSVVRMDYTGDVLNPFIFRTVNHEQGIWSSTSMAVLGDRHFVISPNSVFLTDGIEFVPVSDAKIQNELTDLVFNNATTQDVVVAPDFTQGIIAILVRYEVDGVPTSSAFSFNYQSGIWARRSLVEAHIDYLAFLPALEPNSSSSSSWEGNAVTWDSVGDSYEETWDYSSLRFAVSSLAMVINGRVYLYKTFRNRQNGEEFLLKKLDIDFDEVGGIDSSYIKSLSNLYPISGKGKGYLILKAWGHSKAGEEVTEDAKKNYVINLEEDHKFDLRISGRYISLELSMDKEIVENWESYNFQNYIEKPSSQPLTYLDLAGLDYDISLVQRR